MAIFTFGQDMPEYGSIQNLFDLESLALVDGVSGLTEVTFEDGNGYKMVLIGTGLTFTGGALTAGHVTGVNFLDDAGGDLLTVTSGDYDAVDINAELTDQDNDNLWSLLNLLTSGNDTIYANDKGTSLGIAEDHGNDKIFSGDAGSYVSGSEGNDTLKGGADWDTLSFEETYWRQDARWGIVLNAAKGTVIDSWHDKDKFSGFEEFDGSIFNDRITGSRRDEDFMGLRGKDTIDGGKGWDGLGYYKDAEFDGTDGVTVNLGKGFAIDGFGDRDKIKNIEGVYGTNENDTFIGSKFNNEFRGNGGVDSFNGGKGTDAVNFHFWRDFGQGGATVDLTLSSGQIINDGVGNTETTVSIEAVAGSNFNDDFKLGSGNGWATGRGGDDILRAGIGVQWFKGGDGADTFVFDSFFTLGGKTKRDQIEDFSHDEGDKIDLSGINDDDELFFVGEGGSTGAVGEISYVIANGKTIVSIEFEFKLQIQINREVDLVAGDFVLTL